MSDATRFFKNKENDDDKRKAEREQLALQYIQEMMQAIGRAVKSMNNDRLLGLVPHNREYINVNGKEEVSWSIIKDHEYTCGYHVLGDGRIVYVNYKSKKATPIAYSKFYRIIGWDRVDDCNSISGIISNYGVTNKQKWYVKR